MRVGQSHDGDASYDSHAVAEAWRRSSAARAEALAAATELMLELAGVGPGARVLDVAAGTGDQTLLAARRVGPSGWVLATDISASMLALAAEAARQARLANVTTRVMDARALDLESGTFDAAICRSGLMLVTEPVRVLREIWRVLRPGGRLGVIVFSTAEANPFAARPGEIVRRIGRLPPPAPDEPGMFALSAPGALGAAFWAAGFRGIDVRAVATRRRFESVEAALQNYRESFPSLIQLLGRLSEQEQARAWREIEQELQRFRDPNGLELAGEVLVAGGAKPGGIH